MIDIQLLRMLRVQSDYKKIASVVNPDTLEETTSRMFKAIGRYYERYPSHGEIDFTVFIPEMRRLGLFGKTEDEQQATALVIKNMHKAYPDDDTRDGIMRSLHEHNLVHRLMGVTEKWIDGKEIDPAFEVQQQLEHYAKSMGGMGLPEVDSNIDKLLDDASNDAGIHWRLECINKAMRPLRGGDFGIIAARPDQGKTSFIASELTHMVKQLNEGEDAIWFNNEGPGWNIYPRIYSAALRCTTSQLIEYKNAGTLYKKVNDALGGRKIRVMDVHGYTAGRVESLIKELQPKIGIFDMIDNFQGFGDAGRRDLQLEHMYQWARECCVKNDMVGIATSQISDEGKDTMYPGLSCLKDSKTGKQGACEFQLMIGSMESKQEYKNVRWLSLPKNKLMRVGSQPLHAQVAFLREKALYEDIKEENYESDS